MPKPLSKASTTPMERAISLAIPCPHCKAIVDDPCVNPKGKPREPHQARVRANVPW